MSFKDSKIAAAANSAMTLSAELAVDTEEYTLCTDGRASLLRRLPSANSANKKLTQQRRQNN